MCLQFICESLYCVGDDWDECLPLLVAEEELVHEEDNEEDRERKESAADIRRGSEPIGL